MGPSRARLIQGEKGAGAFIDLALERRLDPVAMAVPRGIVAFTVNFEIVIVRKRPAVQAVSRVKIVFHHHQ